MEKEVLKNYIIRYLPDFESNNKISAEDLFNSLKIVFSDLKKEELDDTLSDMVQKGEIRKPPVPITDTIKYCKNPSKGYAPLPPNKH